MSIASELTALSTNISNAYDAINTKGGTLPANKNTANLANAIDSIPSGGGGNVVNAVIANYKATASTIDANTFVEFVCSVNAGTDTQLSTATNSYHYVSATLISTNKVFVVHRNGSVLYGVVCTISDTTITVGTDTRLSTATNSYSYASVTLVSTDKVLVTHYGSSGRLYGVVCTISDTTITVGTDTQLSSAGNSSLYSSAVTLSTDKVFIEYNNSYYSYGVVCTISGTTITVGTDVQLSTISGSYQFASVTLVSTDKVFVAHCGSSGSLYGVVCTISGTTITVGTDTQLSSTSNSNMYSSAVTLSTDKVFIAHRGGDYLYGVVCTISGTAITVGTDTQLSTVINSHQYASATLVSTDKVFVAHCGNSSSLYGAVCAISGTTITVGTDTQLSTATNSYQYASATLISTDKVFIAHCGNSSTLYGVVCAISDITIQPTTSQFTNIGLTKTECTTSTAGEVWVLNT